MADPLKLLRYSWRVRSIMRLSLAKGLRKLCSPTALTVQAKQAPETQSFERAQIAAEGDRSFLGGCAQRLFGAALLASLSVQLALPRSQALSLTGAVTGAHPGADLPQRRLDTAALLELPGASRGLNVGASSRRTLASAAARR